MSKKTQEWLKRIAEANNVTQEDVLAYLRELSHARKVTHHLNLVLTSSAK